jgi:hypothetical protein
LIYGVGFSLLIPGLFVCAYKGIFRSAIFVRDASYNVNAVQAAIYVE